MANAYKCVNNEMIQLTDAEQAELDVVKNAYDADANKAIDLRDKRKTLLAETDWMANSDVTMSDEWKIYRQALRDLPSKDGFPDVDFPTKPS